MTLAATRFDAALPAPPPLDEAGRIVLFVMRRMAATGLDDAHAQHLLFSRLGLSYRRPLILLRALMLELSRCATQAIQVAPCCCPRMTAGEAMLLDAIRHAREPRQAHALLGDVVGTNDCLGALTTAQAVHEALLDVGLPLI